MVKGLGTKPERSARSVAAPRSFPPCEHASERCTRVAASRARCALASLALRTFTGIPTNKLGQPNS